MPYDGILREGAKWVDGDGETEFWPEERNRPPVKRVHFVACTSRPAKVRHSAQPTDHSLLQRLAKCAVSDRVLNHR